MNSFLLQVSTVFSLYPKLQVYLDVVLLLELTAFFLQVAVFLLRLWVYFDESVI